MSVSGDRVALLPHFYDGSGPRRVIRAFAGDGDVVDVALAQPGAGNADELSLFVHFGEGPGADIAHCCPQAAGKLVQNGRGASLVSDLPLHALRDKLERVLDVLLEVAVGRT